MDFGEKAKDGTMRSFFSSSHYLISIQMATLPDQGMIYVAA
jgi:hypothetical protein